MGYFVQTLSAKAYIPTLTHKSIYQDTKLYMYFANICIKSMNRD